MELLKCSSTTNLFHFTSFNSHPKILCHSTRISLQKDSIFHQKFPSFSVRYRKLPTLGKPNSFRPLFIKASAQVGAADSDPSVNKVAEFRDAFWRFLRPHTIRGTALGSSALVARALIENPNLIRWSLVLKAVCGLVALICGNGYIVGINQIYDIGIDKVNKPYLPIAAGDLSVKYAWILVLMFAVAGLTIVATNYGSFITSLYCLGLFFGTIYSVPPFRMKRFPVVAFLIIATASAQVGVADSDPSVIKVAEFRDAFWKFLRPHTIRGTAVGSCALVTRALIENPNLISWSLVLKAVCGLVALICGNGYIMGINQIYDIGIDKYASTILSFCLPSLYKLGWVPGPARAISFYTSSIFLNCSHLIFAQILRRVNACGV